MNYSIVSAVHSRPIITKAWAKHLAEHFTGNVVVAGDDWSLHKTIKWHLKDQLVWTPYCNNPLGAKWNRALEVAIQLTPYVVILGSDDFPSPELLQVWDRVASNIKPSWAQLDSLYIYSLSKYEACLLDMSRPWGTARMFRSSDLLTLFSQRGFAWTPSATRGLDNDIWEALGAPEADHIIECGHTTWCVATKSAEQLHSYDKIKFKLGLTKIKPPRLVSDFLLTLP